MRRYGRPAPGLSLAALAALWMALPAGAAESPALGPTMDRRAPQPAPAAPDAPARTNEPGGGAAPS